MLPAGPCHLFVSTCAVKPARAGWSELSRESLRHDRDRLEIATGTLVHQLHVLRQQVVRCPWTKPELWYTVLLPYRTRYLPVCGTNFCERLLNAPCYLVREISADGKKFTRNVLLRDAPLQEPSSNSSVRLFMECASTRHTCMCLERRMAFRSSAQASPPLEGFRGVKTSSPLNPGQARVVQCAILSPETHISLPRDPTKQSIEG